jgi:hypothetical protein
MEHLSDWRLWAPLLALGAILAPWAYLRASRRRSERRAIQRRLGA